MLYLFGNVLPEALWDKVQEELCPGLENPERVCPQILQYLQDREWLAMNLSAYPNHPGMRPIRDPSEP